MAATLLSDALSDILDYAVAQFNRDGAVYMADAYKWLFQAILGGEHAAPNEARAREWLANERTTLNSPLPNEDVIEPMRPDGIIVRLHLRPYKAQGGSQDALLASFIASADTFQSDRGDFVAVWQRLGQRLRHQPIGMLTAAEWNRIEGIARPAAYPAFHHSADYRELRQPAYRVLTAMQAIVL